MNQHPQGVSSGVRSATIGGIGSDRLTDRACKAARPSPTARKLSDGKGLYLLVQPSGARLWRLKFRHGGTERTYAIGAYPEVSLGEVAKRESPLAVDLRSLRSE